MVESPLSWWIFGTAGLVATTLTVGAAARLTRTGASTLYWKPRFMHSPKTESEWHDEFDVYRDFCARSQRISMVSRECAYPQHLAKVFDHIVMLDARGFQAKLQVGIGSPYARSIDSSHVRGAPDVLRDEGQDPDPSPSSSGASCWTWSRSTVRRARNGGEERQVWWKRQTRPEAAVRGSHVLPPSSRKILCCCL